MPQTPSRDFALPLEWREGSSEFPSRSEDQEPARSNADNIYDAFAYFLRLEVAHGQATEDTAEAYHREVGRWIAWCQAREINPQEAQQHHLEAFREELKRRGLSIPTRAHKLSIIRQFYQSAVVAGLREDNPADRVWAGKDLASPEDKINVLSPGALSALVDSLPNEGVSGLRDRVIVALMVAHGLRRVEIHRLNREHIQGDLAQAEPGAILVDGKGHRVRQVFLRPDTWKTLGAYLQEKEAAGYETSGALFVGHGNNGRGQRLSRVSINAIVNKYLDAAHLKKIGVSTNALRHTFGTLAAAKGASIEHLRETMGHGRLETTTMYVKAVEKAKNNPAFFIDVEF